MSNEILTLMRKAFKIFIKEENLTKTKLAKVVSYSAPNAVINIAGSTENITLGNKTNQTLVANDKVVVVIMDNDLTNAFIGFKI